MPNSPDLTSDAAPTEPAKPRRRGLGSAKSMVVSMVVTLLGCVVWLWAVPQSPSSPDPVANVDSIAREVGKEQKWRVALPADLPKGWVPINVRLVRAEGKAPTWLAGYQTPNDSFVSAEQTKSSERAWVGDQIKESEKSGTSTIDGTTWTRYVDGDVRMLRRTEPLGGLATVVSGKVEWGELEEFAAALTPIAV